MGNKQPEQNQQQSIKIDFLTNKQTYLPGDNVQGKIIINVLDTQIMVNSLSIGIIGEEQCKFLQFGQFILYPFDSKFEKKKVIFESFVQTKLAQKLLKQGKYDFPFEIQLAGNVPPTFKCRGAKQMSSISYNLSAKLDMGTIEFESRQKLKIRIKMHPILFENIIEQKQDNIYVKLKLPKQQFHENEVIDYGISVNKGQFLTGFSTKVFQCLKLMDEDNEFMEICDLLNEKEERVQLKDDQFQQFQIYVRKDEKKKIKENIKGQLIILCYKIQVIVHFSQQDDIELICPLFLYSNEKQE